MIENWEEFYEEMEKLSLPELEVMIKELYQKFQKSKAYSDDRLNACLLQRKLLINRNFIFTPEKFDLCPRKLILQDVGDLRKTSDLVKTAAMPN